MKKITTILISLVFCTSCSLEFIDVVDLEIIEDEIENSIEHPPIYPCEYPHHRCVLRGNAIDWSCDRFGNCIAL